VRARQRAVAEFLDKLPEEQVRVGRVGCGLRGFPFSAPQMYKHTSIQAYKHICTFFLPFWRPYSPQEGGKGGRGDAAGLL